MEPIVNPEIKIDKRTRAYKDSVQVQGESLEQPSPSEDVESTTTNGAAPDEAGRKFLRGAGLKPEPLKDIPVDKHVYDEIEVIQSCRKCGGRKDLIEVVPDISICRSCASPATEASEPKATPGPKRMKRKVRDYSHLQCGNFVNGVWVDDWSLCSICHESLLPDEIIIGKPTPCRDCVMEDYTKAIINGKEVEIDPTDPPKLHFEDDKQGNEYTELKDSKGKVY